MELEVIRGQLVALISLPLFDLFQKVDSEDIIYQLSSVYEILPKSRALAMVRYLLSTVYLYFICPQSFATMLVQWLDGGGRTWLIVVITLISSVASDLHLAGERNMADRLLQSVLDSDSHFLMSYDPNSHPPFLSHPDILAQCIQHLGLESVFTVRPFACPWHWRFLICSRSLG